jgi:NAD(P)H-nitrite reductase large subunit
MKHVIIGSGPSAISAINRIRQLKRSDEIVLITTDEMVYSAEILKRFIVGELTIEEIGFVDKKFISSSGVELIRGEVDRLDTIHKCVYLKDRSNAVSYDRLLLATGSECLKLQLPQFDKAPNVIGFESLSEAMHLRERLENASSVVIIGAGSIGMDTAYACLFMGKKVTIIDIASRILSSYLDKTSAGLYEAVFVNYGCEIKLNSSIVNYHLNDIGEVDRLLLSSGESLDCDLVISAKGVNNRFNFLNESGIDYDTHIIVDEMLKTSADGVYAAGEVTGYGIEASKCILQGHVAAENMCGARSTYIDTYTLRFCSNYFGIQTISMGYFVNGENKNMITYEDPKRYSKIVLDRNHVTGVILQGDVSDFGFWQYLIKNHVNVEAFNISRMAYDDLFKIMPIVGTDEK